MPSRKIDIYNHVLPTAMLDYMRDVSSAPPGMIKRMSNIPALHDIEARIRMMDQWPGYEQVISVAIPMESMAGPADSPALARITNAELRKICETRPDKFPAWVASLPLNNVDASLEEMDRAIAEGACGVHVFTNIDGMPLDDPSLFPIFERATTYHQVPMWMHPTRSAKFADYPGETKSKYEISHILGWPYETSVAMARLVFSGMYDTLPGMRLITHHLGAMIPFFEGRIRQGWDELGSRTADEDYSGILARMKAKGRRPIDYFRLFYNDTSVNGSRSATRCGIDFFGHEHVLFGTDCPFDPEGGTQVIRETIDSLDAIELSDHERDAIYFGNALSMLQKPGTCSKRGISAAP